MNNVKLFSGKSSRYLAEKIADHYGRPLGNHVLQQFSDGEFQPNFLESIRGSNVFLIQSTCAPFDNLLELLLMIDAAKRASANYITAVIPYFGFARQDRKDKPRVSVGSKLIANILTAAGAHRVMTMDLHAAQIQGFFDIPVDHLNSSYIFMPYIESLGLDNIAFAAPDVGATPRARSYSAYFKASLVICDKYRRVANQVEALTVIGDVEGKHVILVDDIVDTGNTLSKAANLLREKGALSVRAFITHPVLSGNAYETIDKSFLTELVVCDTIPLKRTSEKIRVLTVAELFARAIRHTYEYKSIDSLFIKH